MVKPINGIKGDGKKPPRLMPGVGLERRTAMTRKNALMVPLLISALFLTSCGNQERDQTSAQEEGEHISTDGLSAVELARLLVRTDDKPEVALAFADALSAADDARLEHIQVIHNVARDLDRSGDNMHARQFSKAALRLCVRMMNGDVLGILPFNAVRIFVDLSLLRDSTSIRHGAQKILGDDEGARAFDTFNAAVDRRRQTSLGIDKSLEDLILRIPHADVAYLESEVARFWQLRSEPAAGRAELTKQVSVVIAPELRKSIQMYLEVQDKGDPHAVQTPAEKEKLDEAYALAQEYAWEHPDDPWGEYVAAYGMASQFFDVPANLLEVSRKLPERQRVLAKRLIDAKAKGVPGSHEFFRALGDIWKDFAVIAETQKSKGTDSPR